MKFSRRRDFCKGIAGIAGILASGTPPSVLAFTKSMMSAKNAFSNGIAASYTATDYVQDGLIAMWDGIENAGFGIHDSEAAIWKDLTENGFDLTVNNAWTKIGIVSSNKTSAAHRFNT